MFWEFKVKVGTGEKSTQSEFGADGAKGVEILQI